MISATGQLDRIKELMLDGNWRTLADISDITQEPPASVSAQLRHLRKKEYGGFLVEKQRSLNRASGLYEYRVLAP